MDFCNFLSNSALIWALPDQKSWKKSCISRISYKKISRDLGNRCAKSLKLVVFCNFLSNSALIWTLPVQKSRKKSNICRIPPGLKLSRNSTVFISIFVPNTQQFSKSPSFWQWINLIIEVISIFHHIKMNGQSILTIWLISPHTYFI